MVKKSENIPRTWKSSDVVQNSIPDFSFNKPRITYREIYDTSASMTIKTMIFKGKISQKYSIDVQ